MKAGTTPTHTFKLSVSPALIKNVRVIYATGDKPLLVKTLADGKLTADSFVVRLTQADTFKFNRVSAVDIQVRVLTTSGDTLNSNIMRVTAERCLDTEVMV